MVNNNYLTNNEKPKIIVNYGIHQAEFSRFNGKNKVDYKVTKFNADINFINIGRLLRGAKYGLIAYFVLDRIIG